MNRREFLAGTASVLGYLSAPRFLSAATSFSLQRRVVFIEAVGGWDALEIIPKPASTSGIDMSYELAQAQTLAGTDVHIGRWLPRIAEHGNKVLLVNGLAMGTTSHTAGRAYMNTCVLSNTGRVNSAAISAIVASEGTSTIPIIQLAGASEPAIDRGLLNPVSVVRAEHLSLYRSMYPETDAALAQNLGLLRYLEDSIDQQDQARRVGEVINDRLGALQSAAERVHDQFTSKVGSKLAVTSDELANFTRGAPQGLRENIAQSFALTSKLLRGNICDVVSIGIGGFDTHSNQTPRLQPILSSLDYVVGQLVAELDAADQLDNTLIVITSDFGRTPKVNSSNGRDHWPVGVAMLIGGNIAGGRVVGATDDNFRGLKVDGTTGAVDEADGIQLNPTHVGGSVLELVLGSDYLQYRNYLTSLPLITRTNS